MSTAANTLKQMYILGHGSVPQASLSEVIRVHLEEQHRPNRVLVPPSQVTLQGLHSSKNSAAKKTFI